MRFSSDIPAIYQKCKELFGVDWEKGIAITYGDTVYSKFPLTPDLEAHEKTHIEQQTRWGAAEWWEKYLSDTHFRFDQELEAYRNQVKFIYETVKDRNRRFVMVHKLATDLSGSMYGNLCAYTEAKRLLSFPGL